MTRLLGLTLLATIGCTTGRSTLAPTQPTAVRSGLIELLRPLVETRLVGDGWRGEVLEITRTGQSAANPDEVWDEVVLGVTFVANTDDGDERLLSQTEMTGVLRALRGDVRRVVSAVGGENQDSAEGEMYRERWLICPYGVGDTVGWVKVTAGPASHKAEETTSRLEFVIRESPVR